MRPINLQSEEVTEHWFGDAAEKAKRIVTQHPHFRGCAITIEFIECDQVLLVHGQVPSFYLKQVLQTALRDVSGITRIDNRVDVVSSDGLSSVRRR